MDRNASKTPDPLPFAAWQAMSPAAAAREVHERGGRRCPPPLRRAAVAWLKPEAELAAELGLFRGRSLLAGDSAPPGACKQALQKAIRSAACPTS